MKKRLKKRFAGSKARRLVAQSLAFAVIGSLLTALVSTFIAGGERVSCQFTILGLTGLAVLTAGALLTGLLTRQEMEKIGRGLGDQATALRRVEGDIESVVGALTANAESFNTIGASIRDSQKALTSLADEVRQMKSSTDKSIGVTNRSVMALNKTLESSQKDIYDQFDSGLSKHSFAHLLAIQKLYRDLVAADNRSGTMAENSIGDSKG